MGRRWLAPILPFAATLPIRRLPREEGDQVGKVRCSVHGLQQETLVCQHIAEGLANRKRVGFFWTTYDPDNVRPDACCSACNERVRATGGEWVDEALEQLQPKVLCGACYDAAKKFHMGGDPFS
jgi:hypothetical protein